MLVEPDRVRLFTDFRYIETARAIERVETVQTKRSLIGWLAENLSGRFGFVAGPDDGTAGAGMHLVRTV